MSASQLTIGVLTFVPRDKPQRRAPLALTEAIERRGHRAILAHHGEYQPMVGALEADGLAAVEHVYQAHEADDLAACDALFVRWEGVHASPEESYLLEALAQRIPVINPPQVSLTLQNKFLVYQRLERAGLPVPTTVLIRRDDNLPEIIKAVDGFPLIIKRLRGACGRSVMLVESERGLRSAIDMIWSIDRNEALLLQQFHPLVEPGGAAQDIRLWVIDGEVIGAARRIPEGTEFRANAALGARWEEVEPKKSEIKAALRTQALFGADYLGVDLLRTPEGPLLLDINSNAEFKEFEAATGINVPDRLVKLAEWRLAKRRGVVSPTVIRKDYIEVNFSENEAAVTQPGDLTYRETLDYMYGLPRFNSLLSPERVRHYLGLIGNPERTFRSVVITGSNGKGTTAAMLERLARAAGMRTGLFTSPHLVDFEERIRINGRSIDASAIPPVVAELREIAAREGKRTDWLVPCGFDMFVLLAARLFAAHQVDLAIFECGIGGDCDSTKGIGANVVGLTSIEPEHRQLLGNTPEEILEEKLGLVSPGSQVAHGLAGDLGKKADAMIAAHGGRPARTLDCGMIYEIENCHTKQKGIKSSHFDKNAEQAMRLLLATAPELGEQGDIAKLIAELSNVQWPGRMTILQDDPLVVVDVSHTEKAITSLLNDLEPIKARHGRCVLLLATSEEKCRPEIVAPLVEFADTVVITRASYRSADIEKVKALVIESGAEEKIAGTSSAPNAALHLAQEVLSQAPSSEPKESGWILAAGGFFLAADLLRGRYPLQQI
jgi:dihydrofolate synthase/folylpolyglutamate synthase